MARPRLFFGTRADAILAEAGIGHDDLALAYGFSARTNRVAPNGVSGEAMFHRAYLTVVHFTTLAFRVETFIDGKSKLVQDVALVGADPLGGPYTEANRLVEQIEIALTVPHMVGGVERLRQSLRGTWIEQLVTSSTATFLRVDQVEVEWTPAHAPARAVGVAV
jgi:hypothetical protein